MFASAKGCSVLAAALLLAQEKQWYVRRNPLLKPRVVYNGDALHWLRYLM